MPLIRVSKLALKSLLRGDVDLINHFTDLQFELYDLETNYFVTINDMKTNSICYRYNNHVQYYIVKTGVNYCVLYNEGSIHDRIKKREHLLYDRRSIFLETCLL